MKKISSEAGVGVTLLAAIIFGSMVYYQSRQDYQIAKWSNYQKSKPKVTEKSDQKIIFDTNGTREVFKVERDGKWIVIIDGQESIPFDFVSTPVFSPDGLQFAYSAILDGKAYVVLNNVLQKNAYDSIGGVGFSPDGQKLAYVANKGEQFVVVVDNKESKPYQEIGKLQTSTGETSFIFSQDGSKIAFKAIEDQKVFIVVNGQEGKKYDDISSFVFIDGGNQFTYQAQSGGTVITVINQKEVVNAPVNTTPTTGTNNGSGNNNSSNSGHVSNGSEGRDLNLDPNRLQYNICNGKTANGGQCNF